MSRDFGDEGLKKGRIVKRFMPMRVQTEDQKNRWYRTLKDAIDVLIPRELEILYTMIVAEISQDGMIGKYKLAHNIGQSEAERRVIVQLLRKAAKDLEDKINAETGSPDQAGVHDPIDSADGGKVQGRGETSPQAGQTDPQAEPQGTDADDTDREEWRKPPMGF
jgi:hypothetical protein